MHEATGLDHVGLVGRDLGIMLDAYRRLGFAPTEPHELLGHDARTGRAVSLGQRSAHLVFEQGYVELTALAPSNPRHHLAPYLAAGPRLAILAIGTSDVDAQYARCIRSALPVGPVSEASRAIDYGDRHGEARFAWFMLEPAASPEGLTCFVQHRTPELVFQRAVQQHPNGVVALSRLLVAADDAAAVVQRIALASGGRIAPGGVLALDAGEVQVLDAGSWRQRFPGACFPSTACFAGFVVKIQDLASARESMRARGVALAIRDDGSFWAGPADACGCIVEFTS